MLAIYKREMRSYFTTPLGYVFLAIFLAVSGAVFSYTTFFSMSSEVTPYFSTMLTCYIILLPLLTMKLFAEEKKLRTEQLLLTAPVSIWSMVLGKFFAAATLFVGTVLVSCLNLFPLYVYANTERLSEDINVFRIGPSTPEIISCVIGVILVGLAFISIGLFVSSLTENQLAAAVITVAIILTMLILGAVNDFIHVYAIRVVIDWISIASRFSNFTTGILDYSAILYYLSISGVFLLLTVRVYDKRRWG